MTEKGIKSKSSDPGADAGTKDVKYEGWSSEFVENKGANEVVLRVCRK
jgi:hypothetical protein